MIDIVNEIEAMHREVGTGRVAAGEGRALRMRRTYDAPIDDVWDAITSPSRLTRWFLPVSGDLRPGGRYQLEGNAGGEILACDRPSRFKVTWAYGEPADPADVSELEIRLSPAGEEATTLELEHVAIVPDDRWEAYGPGAVGVGWDQGLLGLAAHLRGESLGDPETFALSEEARSFFAASSDAWAAANVAAGADPQVAATAAANTTGFYAPDPDANVPG